MNIDERENYSQDGQSFQNDSQYKDDDSVSNVLDNSIDEQEYKDADDLDPDEYEEDFTEEEELEEDLEEDEDFEEYEEDMDEEENESDYNETTLQDDINETGSDKPREF